MPNKKIAIAIIYFFLSTLITWWFIEASPLYSNMQQKLLSCGIAGAKWSIQIGAALILLKENKWHFIKNIAVTCLTGSLILLPYTVCSKLWGMNGNDFFVASLVLAVAVMIFFYAVAVKNAGVKMGWWFGWLACLMIAVMLQLTVVFHVL